MRGSAESYPLCPYCGRKAVVVTGANVYPRRPELATKYFWCCWQCDARVGCHLNTQKPLGTLANKALRTLRREAHAAFDEMWRHCVSDRKRAYQWLALTMGIPREDCHIGCFGEVQCRQVIELSMKASHERSRLIAQGTAGIVAAQGEPLVGTVEVVIRSEEGSVVHHFSGPITQEMKNKAIVLIGVLSLLRPGVTWPTM